MTKTAREAPSGGARAAPGVKRHPKLLPPSRCRRRPAMATATPGGARAPAASRGCGLGVQAMQLWQGEVPTGT
eukprot:15456266-Alexandrium_andersonii.AAC.1